MTKITVQAGPDGRILGFVARGHAGGNRDTEYDMICSAVSALTQTAVNALEAVAEILPEAEVSDGYLSCFLPDHLGKEKEKTAETIMRTILVGLTNIEESYPKHIRIEIRNGGKANA
ncbi:MAG: ribosomal-processing cysteine protease Prp [Clostridia bacterium]|nr:ribosomal-processing cysteine protease Prp [Clostridia bacterium]